jgi:hypothetical protein
MRQALSFSHIPGATAIFGACRRDYDLRLHTLKYEITNLHLVMIHLLVYSDVQIMTGKVAQSYRAKIAVQEARFQQQLRFAFCHRMCGISASGTILIVEIIVTREIDGIL